MNLTATHILQEESDRIIEDLIEAYEKSGKKTSGEFPNGLMANVQGNKWELFGYAYLAGRRPGAMPPVDAIEKWVVQKGIQPIERNMSTSSLAWAIAKKIAREGTADESHLPIYEMVITPERIDRIIQRVSEFNAQLFVTELTTSLFVISQKYQK